MKALVAGGQDIVISPDLDYDRIFFSVRTFLMLGLFK